MRKLIDGKYVPVNGTSVAVSASGDAATGVEESLTTTPQEVNPAEAGEGKAFPLQENKNAGDIHPDFLGAGGGQAPAPTPEPTPAPAKKQAFSDAAAKLIAANNVEDFSTLIGTGHDGLVTKADVQKFLSQKG